MNVAAWFIALIGFGFLLFFLKLQSRASKKYHNGGTIKGNVADLPRVGENTCTLAPYISEFKPKMSDRLLTAFELATYLATANALGLSMEELLHDARISLGHVWRNKRGEEWVIAKIEEKKIGNAVTLHLLPFHHSCYTGIVVWECKLHRHYTHVRAP